MSVNDTITTTTANNLDATILGHNKQQQSLIQNLTEIGKDAVWTLSSAKSGNGVQQLRDGSVETFWQSDGPQPHYVNIQFHKILTVKQIGLFCDVKMDESYTPKQISIRIGSNFHDLREIKTVELDDPTGWVPINLSEEDSDEVTCGGVRANMVQIAILSNHQNGRDTHLRQVKVYGPANPSNMM